jgi:broad specificity phosphatase PhoE
MRVISVRHGETDWNEEGVFRGRIDVKLNESGIQQAKIIGKKLSEVQIDAIYSSQ